MQIEWNDTKNTFFVLYNCLDVPRGALVCFTSYVMRVGLGIVRYHVIRMITVA
jgi:hypothetical protein